MPDKTYAKFILNNETYLDLTGDTVDSSSLLSGYTAHDRSGAPITGSFDPSVFVLKAGDTMTGPLILSGAPTENLHAATKKYVDDNVGAVTQENSTSSNNFRILLSTNTTDSTETGKARKSKGLNYTPSAGYLILDRIHGSTTAQTATLAIGNGTANGTSGATYGEIRLYSPSQYYYTITSVSTASVLSGNKSIYLPYGVISGRYLAVTTNSDGDARRVLAQENTSGTYSVLLTNSHTTADLTSYANKNVGFYYEIASSVLKIYRDHSNTATQRAAIELGNNSNDGVSGSSYGSLRIFGKNTYYTEIYDKNSILTANRELYLPNKSGTIAITDDLNSYLPLTGGTLTGNLAISSTDASAGASALGALVLGNSTPTSESGSSYGRIMMYSEGMYNCTIDVYGVLTDYRSLYLPDKNGTLAVTSDLYSQNLYSKNLLSKDMFIQGSLSGAAGADTNALGRLRSIYIPVKSSTTYSLSTGSTAQIYEIHEYNSSRTFIKYTSKNVVSTSITTSSTTKFIKILVRYTDDTYIPLSALENVQMNEGSTLASYTAYVPNIDEVGLYKPYASNLGYRLIQDNAFAIVNNSDLNNWNYIEPGQYVINTNAGAQSLSNCPTQYAFNMRVENAVSGNYGEASSGVKYRVRFITDILGNQYTQYVIKEAGTSSTLSFSSWNKTVTTADYGSKIGSISVSEGTANDIRVRQRGSIVTAQGYITGLSTTTKEWSSLFTISGVDLPKTYVRATGGSGTQAYYAWNNCYIGIDPTTGICAVRKSVTSDSVVTFNLVWSAD
ncbi:MAG: hypothetical protein J6U54_20835 [Clostridiales bacterium]|nr:hypothetical protein [Clostridiales bacterium]